MSLRIKSASLIGPSEVLAEDYRPSLPSEVDGATRRVALSIEKEVAARVEKQLLACACHLELGDGLHNEANIRHPSIQRGPPGCAPENAGYGGLLCPGPQSLPDLLGSQLSAAPPARVLPVPCELITRANSHNGITTSQAVHMKGGAGCAKAAPPFCPDLNELRPSTSKIRQKNVGETARFLCPRSGERLKRHRERASHSGAHNIGLDLCTLAPKLP
ncbi:hypothetical protein K469DRAFT_41424 [Zopfia rhizophila CBS 207.26]|uniref:Uncharacterized protein n=1 Tax=Zopfia rhizophila CBS 207.26 TaxID=1314779 RepID=A0A6A6EHA5_9PEZI|nr:hypothetical protein K469DRAFT_41424 [Zopfia rhizophila CBS 207.26]